MSEIIKKEPGRIEWDPFGALREWMRFDPFRELEPFVARLPREAFAPDFEVRENKDAFVFKADLPGVKLDDVEIAITGDRLTVKGKRDVEAETKDDTIYTYERSYGSFIRTFTLPGGVDAEHAKSELKDGVLTLVVPKTAEAQAKKIPIGAGEVKS